MRAGEFGAYHEFVCPRAPAVPKLKNPPPPSGSLYDYMYDLQSNMWKPWMETVPSQQIDKDSEFSSVSFPAQPQT